jgi:hypothetical protein
MYLYPTFFSSPPLKGVRTLHMMLPYDKLTPKVENEGGNKNPGEQLASFSLESLSSAFLDVNCDGKWLSLCLFELLFDWDLYTWTVYWLLLNTDDDLTLQTVRDYIELHREPQRLL